MRCRIHRGCHEIGGNCVEIESQGKRIVLDIGLPLKNEKEAGVRMLYDHTADPCENVSVVGSRKPLASELTDELHRRTSQTNGDEPEMKRFLETDDK